MRRRHIIVGLLLGLVMAACGSKNPTVSPTTAGRQTSTTRAGQVPATSSPSGGAAVAPGTPTSTGSVSPTQPTTVPESVPSATDVPVDTGAPAPGQGDPPPQGTPQAPAPAPAPPGGPEPTVGTAPPSDSPPPAPGAARPVTPEGRYIYSAKGFEREGTGPTATTRAVAPEVASDVTVRQEGDTYIIVTESTFREGESSRTTVRATSSEARVSEIITRGEFTVTLKPDPPFLAARFPYAAGDTWDIAWKDDSIGANATGKGAILRQEDVDTGLGTVNCFVIELTMKIVTSFGTADTKNLIWVNPATGVTAKSTSVTDFVSGFGASHSESEQVLQSGPSA